MEHIWMLDIYIFALAAGTDNMDQQNNLVNDNIVSYELRKLFNVY